MPQGVEHCGSASPLSIDVLVRIPLMPQGVEHMTQLFAFRDHGHVRIPLMPQGVEHIAVACDETRQQV